MLLLEYSLIVCTCVAAYCSSAADAVYGRLFCTCVEIQFTITLETILKLFRC